MVTEYLATIPSPSRGVWYVGPVAIRAYALFIIAGIIAGVIWGGRRYVARGGAPGRIADLAIWAVPFGLVGGRLYHVITDHELYFGPGRNPWRAFAIWEGGLGIWGAIALGAVGIWLGCRHYRIPMAPVADALAPAIVVAQALGRLGNYFNQELFGSATTLPWGLDVYARTPDGGPAAANLCAVVGNGGAPEFPTNYIKATPEVLCGVYQPTFLYELVWNLLVAVVIVAADRRFRLGGGRVFGLYVAGYTAGRAWIEALRIDPARTQVFGLRVNIVVSIAVFLLAVVFLVLRRHVGREDPAHVAGRSPQDDPDDPDDGVDGAPGRDLDGTADDTADDTADTGRGTAGSHDVDDGDADRDEPGTTTGGDQAGHHRSAAAPVASSGDALTTEDDGSRRSVTGRSVDEA